MLGLFINDVKYSRFSICSCSSPKLDIPNELAETWQVLIYSNTSSLDIITCDKKVWHLSQHIPTIFTMCIFFNVLVNVVIYGLTYGARWHRRLSGCMYFYISDVCIKGSYSRNILRWKENIVKSMKRNTGHYFCLHFIKMKKNVYSSLSKVGHNTERL